MEPLLTSFLPFRPPLNGRFAAVWPGLRTAGPAGSTAAAPISQTPTPPLKTAVRSTSDSKKVCP
ncbi:MAG: hypothetical protein IPM39_26550 [Chloroflexi bacterium]|nr:hypothetical protein [Chloroflexota bacterium]